MAHKEYVFVILFFLLLIPKTTIAVSASGCSLQFISTPSNTAVAPGGQVTYEYFLKNTGQSACADTSISLYYAENEKYVNSTLAPTASDYYWFIDRLAKGKSSSFSVTIQNVPNDNSQMFGEGCASANGAEDACVKEAVTLNPVLVSGLTPVPDPILVPSSPSVPASAPVPPATSVASVQAWLYSGSPACDSVNEYSDGRVIDTLKPEYYTIQSNGTLRQMTVASSGCNGYSTNNAEDIKLHSKNQFVTVSGSYANMHTLLSSTILENAAITTLVNFAVSTGFTGVELDWEGFGDWTAADYANYKNFVATLQNSLHIKGKLLMIDAPAISDTTYQGYFLFKYEDFTDIDYVAIMAYDYQYDFGVGEPVTPEFWLKNVINWAKARLPLHKIIIGIPAYGYHGTLGSYAITIDTYTQSSPFPGFSTRKINSEGEETWISGNTYYSAQPKSYLDRKKALIESLGIKNISVWHLGGNNWFTGN